MATVEDLGLLLARASHGDRSAFQALYDATAPRVFGLVLKIVGSREESEEVALDTFVQVWRQAGRFEPSRGEALTWILMLARSRAIDRLRARSRGPEIEPDPEILAEAPSATENPEESSERSGREARVRRAIAGLSVEQRDALEAVYFRGLSHSEVASAYRLPLGTVKTRVRLGLAKLRERLGEREGGGR